MNRKHKITMSTFKDLGLNNNIIEALTELGYENPTPIQEKSIPQVIQSDKDLKAFAQTGTGKTAAFSLPILEKIDCSDKNTQALILSPTRELAIQIAKNIRDFSKNLKGFKVTAVYGGSSIDTQIKDLKKGCQIVVGTPGRTLDLVSRRKLNIKSIQWVVLDEADEMLNMGFKDQLDSILEATSDDKQTLLFSATFPKEVERIASNYMDNPVEISAGTKNTGADSVSHEYYQVTERTRYPALKRIADSNPDIYGIIFCRTKRETQEIADKLIGDGYNADALHGDLSQAQRDSVMDKFRRKNIQLLVATDVAARGLDVDSLTHVINHKLPDQIENYTHRSGRTGRAGNKGISIVLVSGKDRGKIKFIEKIIKKKFEKMMVPSGPEICAIQSLNLVKKIKAISINESEMEGIMPEILTQFEELSKEDIIKRFVSLEFSKFLNYYKNAPDLNDNSNHRETDSRGKRRNDENMTRFFINVGRRDKLNPARLIGLINDQNIGDRIEIGQIEILDTFSFFELDKTFENKTIEAFENDVEFEGRGVNVEITKKNKGGGGGSRRRGKSSRRGNFSGSKNGRDRSDGGSRNNGGGRRNDRSKKSSNSGNFAEKFGRRRR